jgi:hypothetical protein
LRLCARHLLPNSVNQKYVQQNNSKDFIAPRRQELRTAETQSTLREEIFAQSGDDDWAKDPVFERVSFLFVFVFRQTKKGILCDLCASAVNKLLSAIIGENLRLIARFLALSQLLSTQHSFLSTNLSYCRIVGLSFSGK